MVTNLAARGAAGSGMVLAGGLITASLPWSTPILGRHPIGFFLLTMRDATAGRMFGLTLVMAGLWLLATSWLALCRQVAVRRHLDDRPDLGVDLVRLCTFVWCLPLVIAPPLFSRDGWSYAAQGALVSEGLSPYTHGPAALSGPLVHAVDPMWLDTSAPYGPVPLFFGGIAADITHSPWVLVVGHRLLTLVGLAMLAWAVPRLAGWSGANPALASAVVLASPLMFANGVAGLHNDLLMVGLMAVALVVAAEQGWVWGAAIAGVAAAVKAPGGLVCIGIVLVTLPAGAVLLARVRHAVVVAAVAVGVLLALGAVTALGSGWIAGLTVPGVVDTPLSITTLLGNGLDSVSGLTVFHGLLRALGTVTALSFGAWVTLTAPTGDRRAALTGVGLAMLAATMLSPVVHIWYFLWWLPFIATQRLSRLPMTGLLALSVVFGLVAPLDSSLHGAYVVIVFGAMLAAALAGVLLLTRSSRERLERIVAVGALIESVPAKQ